MYDLRKGYNRKYYRRKLGIHFKLRRQLLGLALAKPLLWCAWKLAPEVFKELGMKGWK